MTFYSLMIKKVVFISFLVIALCGIIFTSCRKDRAFNNSSDFRLILSTNEVMFDTVFSTVGSATRMIYVKNPSDQRILISNISLAGGNVSNFRLNVDGIPGYIINDVEIGANDSIFLFVNVTVDPQNSNTPMVIRDSIVFEVNGNMQDIDLVAWGQDAHYIVADKTLGSSLKYKIVAAENEHVEWLNDKPYLVYGYAVVDSTASLRIDKGCRIHFFNNSGMWIYKGGSINVDGTYDEPVTFQGSRLEAAYSELPGQWDRIWINEGSVNNTINYAVIKNGFIGIQAETLDASMGNKLVLSNTVIRNMTGIGLLSRYYRITAGNCVVSNCGGYSVCLTTGGSYDFRHCTLANYWSNSSRQTPLLVVMNYFEDPATNTSYQGDLDSAYFGNCIIYGNNSEEILLDSISGSSYHCNFDHCLLKTSLNTSDTNRFKNCRINNNPGFSSYSNNDYTLVAGSAAIDAGNINIIFTSLINLMNDILQNTRLANPPPDLGAYDYRP